MGSLTLLSLSLTYLHFIATLRLSCFNPVYKHNRIQCKWVDRLGHTPVVVEGLGHPSLLPNFPLSVLAPHALGYESSNLLSARNSLPMNPRSTANVLKGHCKRTLKSAHTYVHAQILDGPS